MSPITIERVMKERPSLKDLAKKLFNTKPKPINKIIMHVHGGGFISQTSFFHQLYTRNWANNIGVPIYSVDYRLAPDHPYPAALDDCFQVYMWLTSYLKKVFGMQTLLS
jgi:hormone-sensitive lipase